MTWSDVSFVLRSPVRKRILELMVKGTTMTPLSIAKEMNLDKANISRRIAELAQRDMLRCENPEDRKFKFYRITDKGRGALKEVKKFGSDAVS